MRPAVFHLIPHTHWDREWYLPRAAFGARLVGMLDRLVPVLEAHPDLRFTLDGQTVLVEDYLAVRPDQRDRLAVLVRRGQLAVGPWHVLADEIIPSPTALRRNLSLGLADAESLGGAMRVLYSPDAFGHPGWLPGLALDAGIRWGVVWRGLAGDRVRGPDLYRWRGSDGRTILIHHLPPDGYEVAAHLPAWGRELATAWPRLRDQLRARSSTRHVAVPVGADHHAAHPELPELARRLHTVDPTHEFRFSRWEDYFEAVEAERPDPPVVSGELRRSYGYTWTLQGVHATRARLKRRYGAAERWLALAGHWVGATGAPSPGGAVDRSGSAAAPGRRALLDSAWRLLVQGQFHDTLAGTVCDEAAQEQAARLGSIVATCREIVRDLVVAAAAAGGDPARRAGAGGRAHTPGSGLVIAALGSPGVVTAPVDRFERDLLVGPPGGRRARSARPEPAFTLRRADGSEVPYQVLRRETARHRGDRPYGYPDLDQVERCWVAFDAGSSPMAAPLVLRVGAGRGEAPRPADPVRVSPEAMENAEVRVAVGRDGSVTIVDRATGERYEDLLAVVSEPDDGDLYTVWSDPSSAAVPAAVVGVERVAAGPLLAAFAVHWRIEGPRGPVTGRTALSLHSGSGLVRCRIDLENGARNHRLRLGIRAGLRGPARAGDGVGIVVREPEREALDSSATTEWPVPTAPAHEVVSVGEASRRLTVMAPGFFEYQWSADGSLVVTLLRSVGELSREDLPSRPGHAGWPISTPEAQEPGRHRIDLAIAVGPAPPAPPGAMVALPLLDGA